MLLPKLEPHKKEIFLSELKTKVELVKRYKQTVRELEQEITGEHHASQTQPEEGTATCHTYGLPVPIIPRSSSAPINTAQACAKSIKQVVQPLQLPAGNCVLTPAASLLCGCPDLQITKRMGVAPFKSSRKEKGDVTARGGGGGGGGGGGASDRPRSGGRRIAGN